LDWKGQDLVFAASVLSDRGGRVSEDELEKMTGKHMVETTEQGIAGVEHGAFTNKGYICVKGLNRICAPTPADTQMSACTIFFGQRHLLKIFHQHGTRL
jgi:hypothetical protein